MQRYDAPPGDEIRTYYANWLETARDKPAIDAIARFISGLEDSSNVNAEYVLDTASRHFNRTRLQKLADDLTNDIAIGRVEQAEARLAGHNRVDLASTDGIDVLNDVDAIREAFETTDDVLIQLPGALGEFFDDALCRDGFVAFVGPDKRGKSYWLLEMAYRAVAQRRRVAFFEVGDLSQRQAERRMMRRIAGQPMTACSVDYPNSITRASEDRAATVNTVAKAYKTGLSWRKAAKACDEFVRRKVRSRRVYWRFSCHPNSTISVRGISDRLAAWESTGWIPDIVIIDYADILASDLQRADIREQTNDTWKQLRRLSQRLHCLVLTATQSDTSAYYRCTLTKSNFSEDKRKNAHVTGMVGLNATQEEMDAGITRVNWIVRREAKYSEYKCCHVAGCLALARPVVVSCW
jgi:hypothetical protein